MEGNILNQKKHYLAKIYGIPKKDSQTLTAYLFKDNKKSMVYILDKPQKGYVKIVTSYSVVEKHENNRQKCKQYKRNNPINR